MISEKELLHSPQFQFQHIRIDALAKTENGEVVAFGGEYQNSTDSEHFSNGVIEANLTLWNEESPKRPEGYFIKESFDISHNKSVVILIDRRWFFEKWNHDEHDKQIDAYKQFYLDRVKAESTSKERSAI